MRNVCIAPAIIGTVLVPFAFAFSSRLAGPAERFHDAEPHQLPAASSAALGAPEPFALRVANVTPTPLTAEEEDLVAWAYARFALVGLDLPGVDVAFHDDTGPCGGHEGRYRGSSEHREVAVCVPDRGSFASHLHRQRTLVHELAHAWDHANLDPEDRADLLGILDAFDWYAPESDWEKRGAERFAETIVWGLYDQRRRPVLIDVSCQELHADFQAITGFTAPGPLDLICSLPSHASNSKLTRGTRP